MSNNDKIRLQKYIAQCGIASRREAEKLILEGRIKVNGVVVKQLGTSVSEKDKVYFDDKLVHKEERKVYIMLNKPEGVITSVKDQFGRKTVIDLITGVSERIFPVGRLDYNTKGLILLTNDGEFMNRILHPSRKIIKTYIAKVKGVPSENDLNNLRNGVFIDGMKTSKADVKIIRTVEGFSHVEVKIHEGRNRQVRKMFEAVGFNVVELERTAIGKLTLKNLKTGEWKHLTCEEKNLIFNINH